MIAVTVARESGLWADLAVGAIAGVVFAIIALWKRATR